MKAEAGEMVSGGLHAKEMELRHVQEPGQRMPVSHVGGCKGPLDVAPGERLHVNVVGYVVRIIQQQEFVARDRAEVQQGERKQEGGDREVLISQRTKKNG